MSTPAGFTAILSDTSHPGGEGEIFVSTPVSPTTDWVVVQNAPETADNGGSSVLAPYDHADSDHLALDIQGHGTSVMARLRYTSGGSSSTDVVIQAVGFDGNGEPQRLKDSADSYEPTLTIAATDLNDGTYEFTDEAVFDARGCRYVTFLIKTALAGSGLGTPVIEARVI